jgi:hypothetical protein
MAELFIFNKNNIIICLKNFALSRIVYFCLSDVLMVLKQKEVL